MARKSARRSDTEPKMRENPSALDSVRKRATSLVESAKPAKQQKQDTTSKSCTTKSRYFKKDHGSAADEVDEPHDSPSEESDMGDASDFAVEQSSNSSSSSVSKDQETDDDLDDDVKPKRKRKSLPAKKGSRAALPARGRGNELWREGVTTGLEPGTQVVIKKPKARPAGNIPYTEDTSHPNTLLFLKDLKANNDREWLKSKFASTNLSAGAPSRSSQGFYSNRSALNATCGFILHRGDAVGGERPR